MLNKKEKAFQIDKEISGDNMNICQRCKNTYILIWLKKAEDFNDFGLRHCPFCGLLVEELTGSVMI